MLAGTATLCIIVSRPIDSGMGPATASSDAHGCNRADSFSTICVILTSAHSLAYQMWGYCCQPQCQRQQALV
ncbi:hypothetical protein PYCCODRAFT_1156087 [Trametes coccinea BRFM310]|uniref:Uncharacterized protein n=1 Tax=Trametes coccinea (strain BRFM310) TaxID=1353009 RepID=A0A1Y2IWS6_TRAC3|nr:hypothetical protein PYCCODRAFT_1156087 [Trametes coccinea BRFM310]